MNVALNSNVIHESEAQRQHARVRLPAKLKFQLEDGRWVRLKLKDISAGGFSLEGQKSPFSVNQGYQGSLLFMVDALEISLAVGFIVREISTEQNSIRCEFENMGAQETATMRHLITSYLSGAIVTMGDVLNTLSRENFTRPRKQGGGGAQSLVARIKAVTLSTFWFAVGVSAFSLAATAIYDNYFLTKATSAKVIVDTIDVSMPREGIVNTLIASEQTRVEAGKAIATYKTPLVDALKLEFVSADPREAAAIEEILSRSAEGTISSPCDCDILRTHFVAGEYANKGEALFTLVQQGARPQVSAYFNYKDLEHIQVGQSVMVNVAGKPETVSGRIVDIRMAEDGAQVDYLNTSSVNVVVELDEQLAVTYWQRPATVMVEPSAVQQVTNWISAR